MERHDRGRRHRSHRADGAAPRPSRDATELYAAHAGRLYQGRVHHAPYPMQEAAMDGLAEDLIAVAGLVRPPRDPLVHYASGVDVEVFALTTLD